MTTKRCLIEEDIGDTAANFDWSTDLVVSLQLSQVVGLQFFKRGLSCSKSWLSSL
jgi:hypothetical protein